MNIFPQQPELTAADRARLAPEISCDRNTRAFLRSGPSLDDLKRCVLIELERGSGRRMDILGKIKSMLQKTEWQTLDRNINLYLISL